MDATAGSLIRADDNDTALRREAMVYAARRTATWQRRPMSPGVSILFWSLRVYVFFMLGVVALVLLRLAH